MEGGWGNEGGGFKWNVVDLSIPPPLANSSFGIFLFLKTDLPGSLSSNARKSFALINEFIPGGGLQNRDAEVVEADSRKRGGETGVFPGGIPVFVEEKGIAGVPIDENDVGKIAGFDGAWSAEAVNFLILDVFGRREFFKILQLLFQAVLRS